MEERGRLSLVERACLLGEAFRLYYDTLCHDSSSVHLPGYHK